MHCALDATYRLIDMTLNMVIIRLGDILLHAPDDDFLREAVRLDNYKVDAGGEGVPPLPQSERGPSRDADVGWKGLTGAVCTKDGALLQQMQSILAEGEVALFIGAQFRWNASDARNAGQDTKRTQSIRDALAALRTVVIAERKQLIGQEPRQRYSDDPQFEDQPMARNSACPVKVPGRSSRLRLCPRALTTSKVHG